MRKNKEESELSRKKIIEAGAKIFCKKGYSATRLDDIAYSIGMTRGVIYWHFKNKMELFESLVDNALSSIEETVEKNYLLSDISVMEQLRKILMDAQSKSQELMLLRVFTQNASHEKGLKNAFIQFQIRIERLLSNGISVLEQAKSRGEIVESADLPNLVEVIFIFMVGLNSPSDLSKLSNKHENKFYQEKQKALIDIFFNGIQHYGK